MLAVPLTELSFAAFLIKNPPPPPMTLLQNGNDIVCTFAGIYNPMPPITGETKSKD